MKKIVKPLIIVLLCLAAAGAGLYYFLTPETLKAVVAEKGSVTPVLSGTGKIEGDKKVTVYSDVAGVIDEKYVESGERVKAGDLLIGYAGEGQQNEVDLAANDVEFSEKILDAASGNRAKYQKKYNDAVKQIEECKSVYALLEVNILSLDINDQAKNYQIREQQKQYQNEIYKKQEEISEKQSDLAKIEADIKAIELKQDDDATEEEKEEENERIDELTDKAKRRQSDIRDLNEDISDAQRASLCLPQEGMDPETYKQYTIYRNNLETVTRMWSDARTDRDTAQSMLTAYKEIVSDQQQVERSKITLNKAEKELARAESGTVAPTDGIITNCLVDIGAYVEKGVPVCEMQSDNNYKVRMMVSKYDIASVKEGQEAEIKIGNQKYTGKVSKINQSAENDSSGKAKASIEIKIDTDEDLIVGLDADVTLDLEKADGVLRVPTECLFTDDDGSYVFILDDNGAVAKKYVSVGVKDDEYTQVEGLEDGAHVIDDPGAEAFLGEEVREELN